MINIAELEKRTDQMKILLTVCSDNQNETWETFVRECANHILSATRDVRDA